MRLKFIYLLLVIFSVAPCLAETLKEQPLLSEKVKKIELVSQALNQTRPISIFLPPNYSTSDKRYPTLYLLDGERHLPHAVLATKMYQELGVVPELIIVAIENLADDGARERDLYHDKDKFIAFIKTELKSYVENSFRTTQDSTLYGHSLAGFFTINTLAKYPNLFNKYIAASPPLQGLEKELYKELNRHNFPNNKHLYLTIAAKKEEGEASYDAYINFVQSLTTKAPTNLIWQHKIMEEQSHISNYYITFFNGIAGVFKTHSN